MFCGTGKTRIAFCEMLSENFTVIVFPSIALITQFNKDYIKNEKWRELLANKNIMSICSRDEIKDDDIEYTIDNAIVTRFLKKHKQKIISVTYQSLKTLYESIVAIKQKIDLIIFDEAHHIVGSNIQELIFGKDEKSDNLLNYTNKNLFITATPKDENGIIMIDKEDPQNSHCGPIAFEYTHTDAVRDNICKDFEITIDFYTEKTNNNIYRAIARSALTTENNRILTFHGRSETKNDTISDVNGFVADKNKIEKEFKYIAKNEFNTRFKYITINGITNKTTNRFKILNDFDGTKNDSIYVLASCRTIGEGIDLQNANSICYVDTKESFVEIIQNIGRICRNPKRETNCKKGSIILPCFVDANKYKKAKTDDERDKAIRNDINADGNFNAILNVLSALHSNDPDYYELCLKYPNSFSKQEIEANLLKQNYNLIETGSLQEAIRIATGKKIRNKTIETIKDIHIELYTNDINNPVLYYNFNNEIPIKLYYDDENNKYYIINSKNKKNKIVPPNRKKFKINVHIDNEIKTLWNIKNIDEITKKITSCYLQCSIIKNNFKEIYEKFIEFVKINKKFPNTNSTNKEEKKLAHWASGKRTLKRKNKLDGDKIKLFEEIEGWYWDKDYFYETHQEIFNWVINNKFPSEKSKDKLEKKYAKWCSRQRQNKNKNKLDDDKIKKCEEINGWYWSKKSKNTNNKSFDETYKEFLKWNIKKKYKMPSLNSKDEIEKKYAKWCGHQRQKKKKNKLTDEQIKKLEKIKNWYWSDGINKIIKPYNDMYKEVEKWIDNNDKFPSTSSKDPIERKYGKWCSHRQDDYTKDILDQSKIEDLENLPHWKWVEARSRKKFDEIYSETNKWLEENNKTPSQKSNNSNELRYANWICRMRSLNKLNKLSDKQKEKLEKLKFWYW